VGVSAPKAQAPKAQKAPKAVEGEEAHHRNPTKAVKQYTPWRNVETHKVLPLAFPLAVVGLAVVGLVAADDSTKRDSVGAHVHTDFLVPSLEDILTRPVWSGIAQNDRAHRENGNEGHLAVCYCMGRGQGNDANDSFLFCSVHSPNPLKSILEGGLSRTFLYDEHLSASSASLAFGSAALSPAPAPARRVERRCRDSKHGQYLLL